MRLGRGDRIGALESLVGLVQFPPIRRVRQLVFRFAIVWLQLHAGRLVGGLAISCYAAPHSGEAAPRGRFPVFLGGRADRNRLRPRIRRLGLSRWVRGKDQRHIQQADHQNQRATSHGGILSPVVQPPVLSCNLPCHGQEGCQMRDRLIGSILAVAAAGLGFSAVVSAQTPRTPDLSGVWVRAEGYGRSFNPKEVPPMQPWAAARFQAVRQGISDPNQQGRDELDPVITSCAPVGMPRLMLFPRAFEIISTPGRVLMLFEWDHLVRQIFIGQKPPEDPDPIWMGYSTGRWDRDTLEVDTI